jgi:xanthine dehydrogenase accessory factor
LVSIGLGDFMKDFSENPLSIKEPQDFKIGEQSFFLEPVGQFSSVYIIGAGHVAQRLATLTQFVGFRTIVLDDRAEYLSKEFFPGTVEFVLLPDFQSVFTQVMIDQDSYVICVTRGHMLDKQVLSQSLRTNAGYIGMIGSRKKVNTIFSLLEKEGYSNRDFERVHSPIGLSIRAETPEEIAVSIVAELIQERADVNEEK